jgi:hypothetical protein
MKLKDYKGSYPVMLCSAEYGGCDNVYTVEDAPLKCECGSERGVFPYVEYTVFKSRLTWNPK